MAHRAADRRLPHAGIGLSPVITSGIAQQALVAAVALHFTVALHAHEMTETTPTDVELAIHSDRFQLVAPYQPAGDQPQAIEKLVAGFENGLAKQVLLGVTGSGKTFTMANVIQQVQKPTLVMAHNKTLAAQLYGEFKAFFPHNAVEYFVSYYDYYQPEAYVPSTDTFIEKDSSINDHIEQMRLAATKALLSRRDTIVVASVSAIYGLGAPEDYLAMRLILSRGERIDQRELLRHLTTLQYTRNELVLDRGTFRVRGETVDVFPAESDLEALRIELFDGEVEQAAFNPANVVPGISFSPDKMLQGRLFSYGDAQRYRLGVNHGHIPVNAPRCPVHSYHRDGAMRVDGNYGSTLGYEPNSYDQWQEQPDFREPPLAINGAADHWNFREDDDDYYAQPRALFRLMSPAQQQVLFENTARSVGDAPKDIQLRHIANCLKADPAYGQGVAKALGIPESEIG